MSRESSAASTCAGAAAGARGEQQAAAHRSHLHDRDARLRRALVDRAGERLDEHRAGLEGAADQADGKGDAPARPGPVCVG